MRHICVQIHTIYVDKKKESSKFPPSIDENVLTIASVDIMLQKHISDDFIWMTDLGLPCRLIFSLATCSPETENVINSCLYL